MSKRVDNSPFDLEKTDWGVQLKIRPFGGLIGSQNSAMVITADIFRPEKGKKPEIQLWWSGVSGPALSQAEAGYWSNALYAIQEEAKRVSDTLRPIN